MVGLYSDLYAVDLRTRDVTQLTDGERLLDPDLSADGEHDCRCSRGELADASS